MTAKGRNSRKYVANNRALRDKLPPYCTWWQCPRPGDPIDFTLLPTDPWSWTTDHTVALADGGNLYGDRTLQHRRCNSQKERARITGQPLTPPDEVTEQW